MSRLEFVDTLPNKGNVREDLDLTCGNDMKAYCLTLEPRNPPDAVEEALFLTKLLNAPGMVSTWHRLPNVHILVVEDTVLARSIANYIVSIDASREFLVTKIDLQDHDGRLPKEAWDWLAQHKTWS